ncbi:hypothetical protein MATL_G00091140 [Megalops atlanticus]|uniref:Uncharacterized protein n=1 Tax=Megalops atlanticus TaxID=7932 RepID=A0A9D3TEC9_MEGAT|nr:hypothetical protein MATL_G00091140 [Megalops atlanticus]
MIFGFVGVKRSEPDMEDCLHTSSENLSKLVSWAHSHGTICTLIPNLKHLLTEGAHGNLTAMWGCSAGHAYHWPLTATCKTGPKERVCYQDSRSITSDSLSLQGGSGIQPSPGDRFLSRASKGKGDCGQTRDSCDFSNCSEPSEVDDNTEDYNSTLFDIVCESSATDEDGDYEPQPHHTSRSTLRKRGNPGLVSGQADATVKKIKQEVPEDYYIVANTQLTGGIDSAPVSQSPKQTSQAHPPPRSSQPHAVPHKPSSADMDTVAMSASPSGNSSLAKTSRVPAPGGQGRLQMTAPSPRQPDALQRPPPSHSCGPNQNMNASLMGLQLPGHGDPLEGLPNEELMKSSGGTAVPFGDMVSSPACVNPELEIVSAQAVSTEPKAEAAVMDGENALASFITSTLPTLRKIQPLLEVLEELGFHDLEDLDYIHESDLLHVLKPVEVRKLLSRFKTTGQRDVLDIPSSNQRSSNTSPETLISGGYSTVSSNSPISTSSSSAGFTPCQLSDNNWHFSFEIPWDKMPSAFIRKLEKGKRPTKSERLEIIRLIVSEILTICSTPGKKHLSEIARKMVKAYPVAFSDVIEGEIVGSGYDSLTKQLVSRVDNLRRGNTSLSLKRQAVSTSEGEDTPPRRRKLDTYGCINWQPMWLPPDETPESQKCAQEELKKMYKERCRDAKCIENMMRATFFTQRKDIISGITTSDLINEWPYLFETTGMKTHFKELTGMDIDDNAIANKYASVVSYFKSSDKTGKMETIFREMEASSKNIVDVNAVGFLLLLLKYFSEEEDQMFQKMDQTTLPSEVDCAELPSTPCIILCGTSPFVAEHFMLSVDQTIVNGHITVFSDAVVLMFASYYCLNISYPATHGATLEFLQRCIFKINPDKGSKVEKRTSRKQLAVSPKVLSLITKIADYTVKKE